MILIPPTNPPTGTANPPANPPAILPSDSDKRKEDEQKKDEEQRRLQEQNKLSEEKSKKDKEKINKKEKKKAKKEKAKKKAKKRKAAKSSSSDSTSSSSSSSSSSDEDSSENEDDSDQATGINVWKMVEKYYPIDKRPEELMNKKIVKRLKLSDLNDITDFFQKTEKLRNGNNIESLSKDKKPKTKKFKVAKDDCDRRLHPARFCRLPISNPTKWWGKKVPQKRDHSFAALPLDFIGADRKVANKVIGFCHDRTHILTLKHFSSGNLTVASKPLKQIMRQDEDGASTITDMAWETPTNLVQIKEAFKNFDDIYWNLWPYDSTGRSMHRLMLQYDWCRVADHIDVRIDILKTFFDETLRLNAERAINSDCIMSFSEQEILLKDIMVRKGVRPETPFLPQRRSDNQRFSSGSNNPKAPSNWGQGKGKRNFQQSSSSNSSNQGFPSNSSQLNVSQNRSQNQHQGQNQSQNYTGPYASFQGVPTCRYWNSMNGGSCRNGPDQHDKDACRDSYKKKFMHLCNHQDPASSVFCLRNHRRRDHK